MKIRPDLAVQNAAWDLSTLLAAVGGKVSPRSDPFPPSWPAAWLAVILQIIVNDALQRA